MLAHQGRTALYRLHDATGAVIYIGIASNPFTRWEQHAADKAWWPDVVTREIEWFPTREEAEDTESAEVNIRSPKWNSRHHVSLGRDSWKTIRSRDMWGGWEPSTELLAMFDLHGEQLLAAAATRDRITAELVTVLRSGVSRNRVAKLVPWGEQVIFRIARLAGIPGVRQMRQQ